MRRASGSGAETLAMCPASIVLPAHEHHDPGFREKGTANHALMTNVVNGRPGAMAELSKRFPGLGFQLAEHVPHVDSATAEAAYVVDMKKRTSTFLGLDIGRAYATKLGRPLEKYEMGVSLDFAGIANGRHVVRDWKFGIYSSWWQLYVQAMAVLWVPGQTGCFEVDAGFVHIVKDGDDEDTEARVFSDTAMLYLVDLDERADEIVRATDEAWAMAAEVAAGRDASTLPTREGKWCEYCAAYPHCPSKWKLARSLVELDMSGAVMGLTPEQCGAAYKKLIEVEKNIIKKMKDSLKHRLKLEGEFPLPSGKRLRMVQMPGRESLDRPKLMNLLWAKGATPQEINECFSTGAPFQTIKETK